MSDVNDTSANPATLRADLDAACDRMIRMAAVAKSLAATDGSIKETDLAHIFGLFADEFHDLANLVDLADEAIGHLTTDKLKSVA